jgi:phospholipase/carboxylesterase
VHETRDVLGEMGAVVTERIYPRMGHTVNADEIEAASAMLSGIGAAIVKP